MSNTVNMLHLSDIHFGFGGTSVQGEADRSTRESVLTSMQERIREMDALWAPDIIAISGDIAWSGRKADYDEAEIWLKKLLEVTGLDPERLILCPGNHDIDRRVAGGPRHQVPETINDCDRLLSLDNIKKISEPFRNFSLFCKKMGIPPLTISSTTSYLCGSRAIKGIKFNVLNSAWFCRDDNDRGKLCLGGDFLACMYAKGHLVNNEAYNEDEISVSLVHHPGSWLRDDELFRYSDRTAWYAFLAMRTHVILSGHIHGLVVMPNRESSHALLFTGGATYEGNMRGSNFSVFRINVTNRSLERRFIGFNSADRTWDNPSAPKPHKLTSTDSEPLDTAVMTVPKKLPSPKHTEYKHSYATLDDVHRIAQFSHEIFKDASAVSDASVQRRIEKYFKWIQDVPKSISLVRQVSTDKIVGYSITLRWSKEATDNYLEGTLDPWLMDTKTLPAPNALGRSYLFTQTLYCSRAAKQQAHDILLVGFIDQILSFCPDFNSEKPFLFGPRQLRYTQQNARNLGYERVRMSLSGFEIYTCDFQDLTSDKVPTIEREKFLGLISQRLAITAS